MKLSLFQFTGREFRPTYLVESSRAISLVFRASSGESLQVYTRAAARRATWAASSSSAGPTRKNTK